MINIFELVRLHRGPLSNDIHPSYATGCLKEEFSDNTAPAREARGKFWNFSLPEPAEN